MYLIVTNDNIIQFRNYYIGKTWLWWQIWLAVKPNLKCTQFGKYKAEYEEKIALAEANIDKAVEECNAVVAVHERYMIKIYCMN